MAKIMSHWNRLLENTQANPSEFYTSVQEAVKKREAPGIGMDRIVYSQGGFGTDMREYLRVSKGRFCFDVCAAPYGKGFFASTWLVDRPSGAGPLLLFFFNLAVILGWYFFMDRILGQIIANLGVQTGLGDIGAIGILITIVLYPGLFTLFVWFVSPIFDGWDDFIVDMPFVGQIYEAMYRPNTFWKIDTGMMLQNSIHNAVMEAFDELTKAKGIRALTEEERKPVMRDFMTARSGR